MSEILLIIALVLLVAVVAMQVFILLRNNDTKPIERALQRTELVVRSEISNDREEMSASSSRLREELSAALRSLSDSFQKQLWQLAQATERRFERTRLTVDRNLQAIREESTQSLDQTRDQASAMVKVLRDDSVAAAKALRDDSASSAKHLREEIVLSLKAAHESLVTTLGEMSRMQHQQFTSMIDRIDRISTGGEKRLAGFQASVEQKLASGAEKSRTEVATALETFRESIGEDIEDVSAEQKTQFAKVIDQIKKLSDGQAKNAAAMKTALTTRRANSPMPAVPKRNGKSSDASPKIELADSQLPPQHGLDDVQRAPAIEN